MSFSTSEIVHSTCNRYLGKSLKCNHNNNLGPNYLYMIYYLLTHNCNIYSMHYVHHSALQKHTWFYAYSKLWVTTPPPFPGSLQADGYDCVVRVQYSIAFIDGKWCSLCHYIIQHLHRYFGWVLPLIQCYSFHYIVNTIFLTSQLMIDLIGSLLTMIQSRL